MSDLKALVEQIEKLSVLEVAELVKALEEKFGVSASAPVGAVAVPAVAVGEGPEAQDAFGVILKASGANKIGVIKAVRELNQTLGLKEAKDLVEAAPKTVLEGAKKEDAEAAKADKRNWEVGGATVKLK